MPCDKLTIRFFLNYPFLLVSDLFDKNAFLYLHACIVELFIFLEGGLFDGLRRLKIILHVYALILAADIVVVGVKLVGGWVDEVSGST